MKHIAILDNTFYIRNRIRELTLHLDAEILEATNSKQLANFLNSAKEIDLVILEINIPNEDGFGVLKQIRYLRGEIPIIILTSENKRSSFIRGIQEGASDYILKPFDDQFLTSRIVEHLNHKRALIKIRKDEDKPQGLFVDFQNYLDKELRKASKGDYEVSLLITLFFKPLDTFTTAIEKEYHKVSEIVYPKLQKILFDTDLFMPYGSQSFIGILPFCSMENQRFIEMKFEKEFEDLQMEHPIMSHYSIINTFVTFPLDGDNRDKIMNELINRLFKKIETRKIILSENEFKHIES